MRKGVWFVNGLTLDEIAELEAYEKQQRRIAQIRTTTDGATWTRAGGGWRKVSLDEARDGD